MNSECVDLIATDPPFNKNRDFHATPDSLAAGARFQDRWRWDRDVHQDWIDSIQDDKPTVWEVVNAARACHGDDMGAFLCFMAVRLLEMHRILKPTGSIYLHCDPTASHYLKLLMDAVFGYKQFRNEIVWCYAGGGQSKKNFPRKHDIILCLWYSVDKTWTFNPEDLRIPYDSDYKSTVFKGDKTRAPGKTYQVNPKGKLVEDWWRNIPRPYAKEHTGYPTQKPLALYERIIKASSNPGDIVLDPFAGCATTPIAAERLGRQWIGIDIWDKAYEVVIKRLNDNRQLLRDPDPQVIGPMRKAPERTDTGEEAAPALKLMYVRPTEPWQKLTRPEMFQLLAEAQAADGGVVCGGCGRVLSSRFMQLDHIVPRADDGLNDITNRILICGPCNLDKSDRFTLKGLIRENRKTGWMVDEALAVNAQKAARACADRIRFEWQSPEVVGIVQRVRAGVVQLKR